jgi:hypothetical protein
LDTWTDIMANLGGALIGYLLIWVWKYGRKPAPSQIKGYQ